MIRNPPSPARARAATCVAPCSISSAVFCIAPCVALCTAWFVAASSLSGCGKGGVSGGERIAPEELERRIDGETRLVVVDFWAPWCGPCIQMKPIIERVASELKDRVTLILVDIDVNPDVAREHGVSAIPTLVAFRGGEVVGRQVGGLGAEGLRAWIQERLSP